MQDDQAITKQDLVQFGETLATQITAQLRTEIKQQSNELREDMRQMEERLKLHTEETVGSHATDILQAIANVVSPMNDQVANHETRIQSLEQRLA